MWGFFLQWLDRYKHKDYSESPPQVILVHSTSCYTYSRGQSKVYIPFSYYGCSVVRNVLFRFYEFFRSYVRTIADSAITGFECNE